MKGDKFMATLRDIQCGSKAKVEKVQGAVGLEVAAAN